MHMSDMHCSIITVCANAHGRRERERHTHTHTHTHSLQSGVGTAWMDVLPTKETWELDDSTVKSALRFQIWKWPSACLTPRALYRILIRGWWVCIWTAHAIGCAECSSTDPPHILLAPASPCAKVLQSHQELPVDPQMLLCCREVYHLTVFNTSHPWKACCHRPY